MNSPTQHPHVLILGGGFGGLYAAMALRRAAVRVTLIDRCNHHVFSPLVYQVATASLSPADIAQPLRWILRRQKNTRVLLGEASRIDPARRAVALADGEVLTYDYLIVATGVTHTYFGQDEWARHAPGLKEVSDALEIRRRFLLAFEAAEREPDPEKRRAILTFVIVGGGPTGVELAGAMAEIARRAMPAEFRAIDTTTARVILLEGRDRILPTFIPDLSRRARADLESLGVDVWLEANVTGIDAEGVSIGAERIVTGNVFWAAGVAGSPLGASLDAPLDRAGRVLVNPDLSIPGHPEIFVLGDLAVINDPRTNEPVPGVAPAAMQMGRHVARIISSESSSIQASSRKPQAPPRPAFRYTDKGMLATIGRNRAVGTVGRMRFTGFAAWFVWLFIHIIYLTGFRNRIIVLIQWAWAYLWFQRGARLITGRAAEDLKPRARFGTIPLMPHELREQGFVASDDPARLDFAVIHGHLSTCYWSPGIPLETVRRAAANSIAFGVYQESGGAQVGYARVVTDRATYAYLADVFILESHCGRGLSKMLMRCIVSHPDLQNLRRWMLMTRDAHGLYSQFGFNPLKDATRAMERLDPDGYKRVNCC